MSINKSQEFLYFQNKAKHYDTIKNMKSSVKDKLQSRYLKTLSFSQRNNIEKSTDRKGKRFLPLMRQIEIKEDNQKITNRILKIHESGRTQINVQGNYSRFNREQRRFRSTNPYQQDLSRTIQIGNNGLQQRLKNIKPKVGNSNEWSKHFGKTLQVKKNMSRYMLESSRSKASLHISLVDSYVPKYFESFLNTSSVLQLNPNQQKQIPKEIQITHEALLTLPDIKSKQSHPAHSVRHTKDRRKLIFDSSKSSLIHNKSQQSLKQSKNQQKRDKNSIQKVEKNDKRRLLEFKFTEVNPEVNQNLQKNTKRQKQTKQSENDSTLKYQQSQRQLNEDQNFSFALTKGQNPSKQANNEKVITA